MYILVLSRNIRRSDRPDSEQMRTYGLLVFSSYFNFSSVLATPSFFSSFILNLPDREVIFSIFFLLGR